MRTFLRAVLVLLLIVVPASALAQPRNLPEQRGDVAVKNITLRTGVTLQYAEAGNPKGETLLFIHGYTDSWQSFRLALPDVSHKYRSVAVTLRGFGDSSRPETGYTGADFTADIIALMDQLHIKKAILVGHSMGSFIAQQVAFTHPKRVAGLVLVGSAVTPDNPVVRDLKAYVDTLDDPIDPQFVQEFQAGTAYRPLPEGFLDVAVAESLKAPAHVWKAAIDGVLSEDHSADLSKIKAPTLIMWGDRDSIFSRTEQDQLVAAIKDAQLDVFPETGHAIHWEDNARFVQHLMSFAEMLNEDTNAGQE